MPTVEPDEYLCAHIQDALARDPRVGELGIDVRIRGDKVFLTGAVCSEERREAVAAVAVAVAGGRTVCNETVVTPVTGAGTIEALA